MGQTAAERKRAQRQRDRLKLGDAEYKRIEREKMRKWRASKAKTNPKPKRTTIINNQPQAPPPQPQQQAQPQPKTSKKPKAQQQLIRQPVQVVKDFVPLYKLPNATPISDNSITTYLSQFKKGYEHFTNNNVPARLKNELIKVLELKNIYIYIYTV